MNEQITLRFTILQQHQKRNVNYQHLPEDVEDKVDPGVSKVGLRGTDGFVLTGRGGGVSAVIRDSPAASCEPKPGSDGLRMWDLARSWTAPRWNAEPPERPSPRGGKVLKDGGGGAVFFRVVPAINKLLALPDDAPELSKVDDADDSAIHINKK